MYHFYDKWSIISSSGSKSILYDIFHIFTYLSCAQIRQMRDDEMIINFLHNFANTIFLKSFLIAFDSNFLMDKSFELCFQAINLKLIFIIASVRYKKFLIN